MRAGTGTLSKIPEEGLRNLANIFLRADTPLRDIKVGVTGVKLRNARAAGGQPLRGIRGAKVGTLVQKDHAGYHLHVLCAVLSCAPAAGPGRGGRGNPGVQAAVGLVLPVAMGWCV